MIDLETTSLEASEGKIVEIGMVELDTDTGEIHTLINALVKEEGFRLADQFAWIFAKSTLLFDDIKNAPPLELTRPALQANLNFYPTTAFNKKFDFGYLYFRRFAIPNQLPCIMETVTPIMKLPHWKYKYKYPSMEEAWKYFMKTPYTEVHRACDDATHEAQLLNHLIQTHQYPLRDSL